MNISSSTEKQQSSPLAESSRPPSQVCVCVCVGDCVTRVSVCVCSFVCSGGKLGFADAYTFPGLQGPDPFSTPRGNWDLFYKEIREWYRVQKILRRF